MSFLPGLSRLPILIRRVTLDTEKDSLGMPRATLHWVLTPLEKHSVFEKFMSLSANRWVLPASEG